MDVFQSHLPNPIQIDLTEYVAQRKSTNCIVFIHKTQEKQPSKENLLKKAPTIPDKKTDSNNTDVHETDNKISSNRITQSKQTKTNLKHPNVMPVILPKDDSSSETVYIIKRKKNSKNKKTKTEGVSVEEVKITENNDILNLNITDADYDGTLLESIAVDDTKHTSRSLSGNSESKSNISILNESSKSYKLKNIKSKTAEQSEDPKTKIIFMNDIQRSFLNQSIKLPILNAIEECKTEIHDKCSVFTNKITSEKANETKLNYIYKTVKEIDKNMNNLMSYVMKNKTTKEPVVDNAVARNAQIVEDLNVKKMETIRSLSPLEEDHIEDYKELSSLPKKSLINVRPKVDHVNRMPARFCWTDANNKIS